MIFNFAKNELKLVIQRPRIVIVLRGIMPKIKKEKNIFHIRIKPLAYHMSQVMKPVL